MALTLKLQMRLSQQLIMTPQLQQAIKLLQLSRQELEELIDQALIENPVLEETTEDPENPDGAADSQEIMEVARDVTETPPKPDTDFEWQQYIASGSGVIPERYSRDDRDDTGYEATLSSPDTLQEHLLWQLDMTPLSPLEKRIGENLVGNLDEDGYLVISILELLETNLELHEAILTALRAKRSPLHLPESEGLDPALFTAKHLAVQRVQPVVKKKAPPDFAEEDSAAAAEKAEPPPKVNPRAAAIVDGVLRCLQSFDPAGVGARSLQECLEIQLFALGLENQLPHRIVQQDLKLLENKDLRKIARRRKCELDEVLEAYRLIMSLEPKPGRPFVTDRAQHIIPDVFIYKSSSDSTEGEERVGHYRVVLNDSGLSRIRISNYYKNLAEKNKTDSSLTNEYIQEKIKAGNWLMKSIEQRQKTIFRVTKSILKHQYEFFERGINYLIPLVLKDVAEDISVHESTVSRITTNKFVHTPQGIFELKYFFTSGIDQEEGEAISSRKIKDIIQKIIAGEDAREPLTDIQIAERLSRKSKIKVARRTVAKYREALHLLPSNKRKQLF